MTTPPKPVDHAAQAEAQDLLRKLVGSTRRDRVAFTLGYVLAFDAMAPHVAVGEVDRHLARAEALNALCDKEFE